MKDKEKKKKEERGKIREALCVYIILYYINICQVS